MATLTMSLSGSSVLNGTKSWTITDVDLQTLINSIIAKNTVAGQSPPTPAQALGIWAQEFVTTTIQEDRNYRIQQAVIALDVPAIVFA